MDSDDYIANDMVEKMLHAAREYNALVVCCGRIRVTKTGMYEMHAMMGEHILTGEDAIKQILIGGVVEEAAWDKLYKANVFTNRRFPIGEINEDIVQTIEILGGCQQIVHVGKALYYYCENENSITTSKYTPRKKVCIEHLNQIAEYLKITYPTLLKYFHNLELRYYQGLLYLLLDNTKTLNDNKDDYREIFNRFKVAFKKTYGGKGQSSKERMKGFMIYFRLYFWIHLIIK